MREPKAKRHPRKFIRVCTQLGLDPDVMSTVLCEDFANHPPRCIRIVSRARAAARRKANP